MSVSLICQSSLLPHIFMNIYAHVLYSFYSVSSQRAEFVPDFVIPLHPWKSALHICVGSIAYIFLLNGIFMLNDIYKEYVYEYVPIFGVHTMPIFGVGLIFILSQFAHQCNTERIILIDAIRD